MPSETYRLVNTRCPRCSGLLALRELHEDQAGFKLLCTHVAHEMAQVMINAGLTGIKCHVRDAAKYIRAALLKP